MPTTYDQIYQKFLEKITDVDLISLPEDQLREILRGYLDTACSRFLYCFQDLSQRDNDEEVFLITLEPLEIEILANIMTYAWVLPKINKLTLLKQVMSDGDFKITSQANHLKELNSLKESIETEYNKLMMQYTYLYAGKDIWNNLGPNASLRDSIKEKF